MWRIHIRLIEEEDITFVSPDYITPTFLENRMGNPKWIHFRGEFDMVAVPISDVASFHIQKIGDTAG